VDAVGEPGVVGKARHALLETQCLAAHHQRRRTVEAAQVAHVEGDERRLELDLRIGFAVRQDLGVEGREAAAQRGVERVERNLEDAAITLLRRHRAFDVQLVGKHHVGHLLAALLLADHLALRIAQRLHPALDIRNQQQRADHGLAAGIGGGEFLGGFALALAACVVDRVDLRQRNAKQQHVRKNRPATLASTDV
jgi:hypothetical protein